MKLRDTKVYSFRFDENVPNFQDDGLLTVMDAQCGLCAKGAKWIVKNDSHYMFCIIPIQSNLGESLLRHYDLNPKDPASWLFIDNGQAFTSLDAMIRASQYLGGFWRLTILFRLMPRSIQDLVYGMIARNRYKFFGRTDLCEMPDPEVQKRLLK